MRNLITKLYQLAQSSHIVSTLFEPAHIIILALPFVTLLIALIVLSGQLHSHETLSERRIVYVVLPSTQSPI